MRRAALAPSGSGLVEWVVSFPVFLLLALLVLQLFLVAAHGLFLTYSAKELSRRVSVMGLASIDQERAASEVLGWIWTKGLVHPSPEYLKARLNRSIQIILHSPTLDDLRRWTRPGDGRFLPIAPGEQDTAPSGDGGRTLSEASTVDLEVISAMHFSIPIAGRAMGEVIALASDCYGPIAIREECLFLQARHPMHPGKPMLPVRRSGKALLQPAIQM